MRRTTRYRARGRSRGGVGLSEVPAAAQRVAVVFGGECPVEGHPGGGFGVDGEQGQAVVVGGAARVRRDGRLGVLGDGQGGGVLVGEVGDECGELTGVGESAVVALEDDQVVLGLVGVGRVARGQDVYALQWPPGSVGGRVLREAQAGVGYTEGEFERGHGYGSFLRGGAGDPGAVRCVLRIRAELPGAGRGRA